MKHWIPAFGVVLLAGVLAACARTAGLRVSPAETAVQPQQVSGSDAGRPVAWGGTVIAVENLADLTRLEVLAFPLNGDGVPDIDERPTGRFLADYRGYLDPVDYAPGRRVTLRGTISGTHSGKVGDAPYRYAVIEATEARLWPPGRSGSAWWPPRLHIGIGVYGGF